ncbi:hypothetical protein GCM10009552_15900 [Rothia nasimurium]|uniref:Uncharacterized protein n=1 Tax=Luteibacter anthropi TaxID=564369 RepID=A0A7X5ZIV1_9GAMM|nr:hypothetical protein [Luteibacter anthropi]NII07252.1 hypothetical protein [Luteibacter anthropi]
MTQEKPFDVPFKTRIDAIDGEVVHLRARYLNIDEHNQGKPPLAVIDRNEDPVEILESRRKYRLKDGRTVVTNESNAP